MNSNQAELFVLQRLDAGVDRNAANDGLDCLHDFFWCPLFHHHPTTHPVVRVRRYGFTSWCHALVEINQPTAQCGFLFRPPRHGNFGPFESSFQHICPVRTGNLAAPDMGPVPRPRRNDRDTPLISTNRHEAVTILLITIVMESNDYPTFLRFQSQINSLNHISNVAWSQVPVRPFNLVFSQLCSASLILVPWGLIPRQRATAQLYAGNGQQGKECIRRI